MLDKGAKEVSGCYIRKLLERASVTAGVAESLYKCIGQTGIRDALLETNEKCARKSLGQEKFTPHI